MRKATHIGYNPTPSFLEVSATQLFEDVFFLGVRKISSLQ
jgi:hypothetical protein